MSVVFRDKNGRIEKPNARYLTHAEKKQLNRKLKQKKGILNAID